MYQIEINNCAFRRDGRIEAQCDIGAGFTNDTVQNGTVVLVDKVNKVLIPYDDEGGIPAIVYTAEHQYDERAGGLADFAVTKGAAGRVGNVYVPAQNVYPRVGYLSVGDIFTTDAYDGEAAGGDAVIPAATTGVWTTKEEEATGLVEGLVLEVTTLPDGTAGVKIQITKA